MISYVSSQQLLNLPPDRRHQISEAVMTAGGFPMNHSIYSADRATHLKIVAVALVAGIAVAGFGISARINATDGYTQSARVIKAGQPVTMTSSGTTMVR